MILLCFSWQNPGLSLCLFTGRHFFSTYALSEMDKPGRWCRLMKVYADSPGLRLEHYQKLLQKYTSSTILELSTYVGPECSTWVSNITRCSIKHESRFLQHQPGRKNWRYWHEVQRYHAKWSDNIKHCILWQDVSGRISTGWFVGIPLLDYHDYHTPQYTKGSTIPHDHQPIGV